VVEPLAPEESGVAVGVPEELGVAVGVVTGGALGRVFQ
jgi:hypothetical protein